MTKTIFGTDGVRGRANTYPITAEAALRLAEAAGRHFRRDNQEHRVVIGKDTRLSGYMLENALTAGFTSTGMNVLLLGPVPTPAVGFLTRSMRADIGVMISASHNPAADNGIKFFGPDGFKLSDEDEAGITQFFHDGVAPARPENIGRAKRIDDAMGRYVEYAKTTFPKGLRLDGLRIVLDCANGAAYKAGPILLHELGAEIIPVGVSPDGCNINLECGSTHPGAVQKKVLETRADLGICLDGDADRLILVDETGRVICGDQILALIARRWAERSLLRGEGVVATVMSNLGLERYLDGLGLHLERTSVGDRHVVEAMRSQGYNLGGEQSGHIVLTDFATTGDGMISALQFLAAMIEEDTRASKLSRLFQPIPQKLVNLAFDPQNNPLDGDRLPQAIRDAEKSLGARGRVLIRKSGTEPLLRIMVECEGEAKLEHVMKGLVKAAREG